MFYLIYIVRSDTFFGDFVKLNIASTSAARLSTVGATHVPRSRFPISTRCTTNIFPGLLYPLFLEEVLPGDTWSITPTILARLNPLFAPLMDNFYISVEVWSFANRLVWENWHKFNGAQDNPGDSVDYEIPWINTVNIPDSGFPERSPFDYLGLPVKVAIRESDHISVLPFRGMNLIWNTWYRDQNLQPAVKVPRDDAPDSHSDYELLPRAKRYDYFTGCLPQPQKGPAVDIPIGQSAPVTVSNIADNPFSILAGTSANRGEFKSAVASHTGAVLFDLANEIPLGTTINAFAAKGFIQSAGTADLSKATSITINALRQAFQAQRMFERDMRGGTRYTEILRSHFGVISPDARMQLPEYLGGSSTRVEIQPVPQTSASQDSSPQGNLAAFGIGSNSHQDRHISRSFTEHGYIMAFVSVRSDVSYQQGMRRLWTRRHRFDFYWPSFAGLGEQAVLNREIYYQGNSNDDDVFGYRERYEEYRTFFSSKVGGFRSIVDQSLDVWHLAQFFVNLPKLSDEFIRENPPWQRVVRVKDEPPFLVDFHVEGSVTRPMPARGTPGGVDRF